MEPNQRNTSYTPGKQVNIISYNKTKSSMNTLNIAP